MGWDSPGVGLHGNMTAHFSSVIVSLLSTHDDRQSVDRSFTVCFFVFFVCLYGYRFSGEDKSSGVKFCTLVRRRPGQGISHFGELCLPFRESKLPKNIFGAVNRRRIGRLGRATVIVTLQMCRLWNRAACGRRMACVDIRPSPKTDVPVYWCVSDFVVL